jgi:hypothetical protein
MGLIINPRGAGGAGKTELVRRIMRDYGWAEIDGERQAAEPIVRPGRACPLGYRLRHPLRRRPLVVLGHYERTSGGCDTIGVKDGGLAAVFRLAADYARNGHDVLIEGHQLSSEWERSAVLAKAHPLHVLQLDTPTEASARNLARRRRAARRAIPAFARAAAAERERVAAACERLRPYAHVHRVRFDDALETARELLRLEMWRVAARVENQ